jgi:hypothetical protein
MYEECYETDYCNIRQFLEDISTNARSVERSSDTDELA